MKKFFKKLSDIRNAMRVLEIMDKCGCDIEKMCEDNVERSWRIKPKWYVTKEEAEDLRKIVLYKQHYCKRSKMWEIIFKNTRDGYRFL